MSKRQKRKQKISFSEVRYPKRSALKASGAGLPDEIFWPAYYGRNFGGIEMQSRFFLRWHAIQYLEGGFKGDDARLLESRQMLIALSIHKARFRMEHGAIIESAAFKARENLIEAIPIPKWVNSNCVWTARAGRAYFEYGCGLGQMFAEFYKRMDFSSSFDDKVVLWFGILMGSPDHDPIDSTVAYESGGLCPIYAFAAMKDFLISESKEISGLLSTSDFRLLMKYESLFLSFLRRQRAAYVKAHPTLAVLDEKYGHSNFGLDIDVCQLKAEII